jgi:large conductance mechanosensitive channel
VELLSRWTAAMPTLRFLPLARARVSSRRGERPSDFRRQLRDYTLDLQDFISHDSVRALTGSMSLLDEFKAFVMKGDLIALAVAVVVGLALVALIMALVMDVIDPLIAAAVHVNFAGLFAPTVNGSTFLFGAFLGAVINFLILMAVVFFLIVKPAAMAQARRDARKAKEAPTTRDCPFCFTAIPVKASRCPSCTSTVTPTAT